MSAAVSAGSLDRFLHLGLEYLLDSRVGIIESVREIIDPAGAPGIFQFAATGRGPSGATFPAGGASTNRRVALAKCIGEIVERYGSDSFDPDETVVTSFAEAKVPCLDSKTIALYTAKQFSDPAFPSHVSPFDENTKLGWVPARELGTNATRYVPAAKVFFPYDRSVLGEPAVFQPFTTGLASHEDLAEATLGALCEVVERDAFSIVWQARMSIPEIRLESLDEANRDLVARHVRSGRELRLFDMTLDHGIPSVLAILRSPDAKSPALVFAAATETTPSVAVRKCLEEMQLMRGFAEWLHQSHPRVARKAHAVETREEHVLFYCDHESTPLVDFLLHTRKTRDLDELPSLACGSAEKDLARVVETLGALGYPVLVKELALSDLSELGFSVVRAVVPGFQPLAFGHVLRALALPRLWTVPQQMGYPGIDPETGDNPAPHPFP